VRGKQKGVLEESLGSVATAGASSSGCDKIARVKLARELETDVRQQDVYEALRRAFFLQWKEENPRKPEEAYTVYRGRCRQAYSRLPGERKAELLAVIDAGRKDQDENEARLKRTCRRGSKLKDSADKKDFGHASGLMLTFNGPWGDFTAEELGLPVSLDDVSVDTVCEYMSKNVRFHKLRDRVVDWLDMRTRHLKLCGHAAALEVCPKTWRQEKRIKVHLHTYLEGLTKVRIYQKEDVMFLATAPFLASAARGRTKQSRGSAIYYCCSPKYGSVWSTSTHEVFTDVNINPEWITSMLQALRGNRSKDTFRGISPLGFAWGT
jgi:hypothetical protein